MTPPPDQHAQLMIMLNHLRQRHQTLSSLVIFNTIVTVIGTALMAYACAAML